MRIVIETEEHTSVSGTSATPRSTKDDVTPGAVPATNAGPPSAALLQVVGGARALEPGQAIYRDGMNGGGPSLELVKAIQAASTPDALSGESGSGMDGGAAPLP
jgi:hypothetical protein